MIIDLFSVSFLSGDNTPSPQVDSSKPASETEVSPERQQPDVEHPAEKEAGVEEQEEDPSRSEGLVRYIIVDFSKITSGQFLSEPTYIRNLPWYLYKSKIIKTSFQIQCCLFRRLLIMPRESNSNEGKKIKGLGVFVQCNPKSPFV